MVAHCPSVVHVVLVLYIQDLLMIWRIHIATFLGTQSRVLCNPSPLHPKKIQMTRLLSLNLLLVDMCFHNVFVAKQL